MIHVVEPEVRPGRGIVRSEAALAVGDCTTVGIDGDGGLRSRTSDLPKKRSRRQSPRLRRSPRGRHPHRNRVCRSLDLRTDGVRNHVGIEWGDGVMGVRRCERGRTRAHERRCWGIDVIAAAAVNTMQVEAGFTLNMCLPRFGVSFGLWKRSRTQAPSAEGRSLPEEADLVTTLSGTPTSIHLLT